MGEDPTQVGCDDFLYGAVRYIYPSQRKKKRKTDVKALALKLNIFEDR